MGPPGGLENGAPSREVLGHRGLIDGTEYVRVLEQALRALGYEGVAQQLERASGIEQQPAAAAQFRSSVLSGDFDAALRLLPSVAAGAEVTDRARFLLLRQKYTEAVQCGETAAALQVLRLELQPLRVQQQVLHSLAALLLRSPAAAAAAAAAAHAPLTPVAGAGSSGGGGGPGSSEPMLQAVAEGRAGLLEELQDSLMPSLIIPERRLEELVEQALVSQLERSRYHNSLTGRMSLFTDYQAGADQLPTQPGQVLAAHSSEVWSIAFSPDGRWAASASKDGTALLWAVTGGGRFEDPRQLVRHLAPCQLVAFSPDSRLVLTASLDCIVRVHDVASCKQLQQFSVSDDGGGQLPQQQHGGGAAGASAASAAAAVVAVSWFPDSRRFLAATRKALAIYDAHQSGGLQRRLAPAHTFTYDAVVGPGGGCIISIGQDKQIAFHRLSDQHVVLVPESGACTSLHLSPCGRFLTTNLSDSSVHLWQLPASLAGQQGFSAAAANGMTGGAAASSSGSSALWQGLDAGAAADPFDALPTAPLHELRQADARLSRYVLRSCVGGATSGFVACGAEDARLYLWSRVSGELLECLQGHSGCINAVAWSPANQYLLASASDDGTIRTWLAPAAATRR